MYDIVSKFILYGETKESDILKNLADIIKELDCGKAQSDTIVTGIYRQVKRLLELATDYGFDDNLWHNYLSFILVMDENPFSLSCEKTGANNGSVNAFAKNDFEQFIKLFNYDFSTVEKALDIDCFTRLEDYNAIQKPAFKYNQSVSEKVRALSKNLETTHSVDEFYAVVTQFYKDYGVGMFGLNKAFRFENIDGDIRFQAVSNMDKVVLGDLVGYEIQKKKLRDNTRAFVEGKSANNCLLFGDSGTGKSTSIKAIVNEYYDMGLRMIEIYKHQFKDLSNVIAKIKNRNYKFIIYMDDLSFEEFEVEYKFLKAVIEGGVETRPDNILIYATSNRRHLIKETWSDRSDMEAKNDIHRSDTMEEKLSLVHRFGVTINYSKPTPKEYFVIAIALCRRLGVTLSDEKIEEEAKRWELSHGGISGRTAQQFANYMAGEEGL